MNVTELLAPEMSDDFRKEMTHGFATRVGTVYEIEMIAKDGRRVPLEVSTEVILRDGRPVEIQGIALPSLIRNQSLSNLCHHCLDKDFFLSI